MQSKVEHQFKVNKRQAKDALDFVLERNELTDLANYGKSLILFSEGRFEKCEEYSQKAVAQGLTSESFRINELITQTTNLLQRKVPQRVDILKELNLKFLENQTRFVYNFVATPKPPKLTDIPLDLRTNNAIPLLIKPLFQKTSGERRDFFCMICKKGFTKMFSLNRHMMIHTGTKNHHCNICNRSFIQKTDRDRHEDSHKSTYDVECTFFGCAKRFKTQKNMKSHLVSHSASIPLFKCQYCKKLFNRKRSLQLHEANHKDKHIECDICGKKFVCKSYIRSHIRVHVQEKPFKCSICEHSFKRHYDMNFHFRIQHKDV